jgi:hypothetical protein
MDTKVLNSKKLADSINQDVLKAIQKRYLREERLNIFLCHSHKDKHFIQRLARDLEKFHILVWWDKWQLEPGDSLHQCIGKAIEKSAYVGVVLSPNSLDSNWCQSELEQALAKEKRTGNKVVLPLLYRRVQVPPFLEGRLYLNFNKRYYVTLARLVAFLLDIPTRFIMQELEKSKPKSIEEIQRLIYSLADHSSTIIFLSPSQYSNIRSALKEMDISIPIDSFRISSKNRSCICCDLAMPLKISDEPIITVFQGEKGIKKSEHKSEE